MDTERSIDTPQVYNNVSMQLVCIIQTVNHVLAVRASEALREGVASNYFIFTCGVKVRATVEYK